MGRPGFLFHAVIDRLHEHRAQGHDIALVTGSFRELVNPLAEYVRATTILAAPLETAGGAYTGRLLGLPTIGAGKGEAIVPYLSERGVSAADCFGYGDDITDVPFLEQVGRPTVVVHGTQSVPTFALQRGWAVLRA